MGRDKTFLPRDHGPTARTAIVTVRHGADLDLRTQPRWCPWPASYAGRAGARPDPLIPAEDRPRQISRAHHSHVLCRVTTGHVRGAMSAAMAAAICSSIAAQADASATMRRRLAAE
jgi:hypothetical protein